MNKMKTKNKTWFSNHSHIWIGIIIVLLLVEIFIIRFPVTSVLTYAMISLISIFIVWLLLPEKILQKLSKKKPANTYDFGWSTKFLKGFGYASLLVFLLAFYSYYVLAARPILQIMIFTLLLLFAVNLFIGNIIAKSTQIKEGMILPYVDLFAAGKKNILDVGCGAGRTTISLLKGAPGINIIVYDRFDAHYINDGGKTLLKQNLELAGITSQVKIEQGDILEMPFDEESIDAAVSAYMFDHLGENKLQALQEMWRILRPGGRFLLVLIVRGYSSFALANLLCLAFDTRKDWRLLFKKSHFSLIDEGNINFGTYFLIEKPLE